MQIKAAKVFFSKHPKLISNFILKPESEVYDINRLIPLIEELRSFDIIGITEKELGKNLLVRLKKVAQLKSALLSKNILAPIHIWGGLDPMVSPLFYYAGADIFDGISWLRYYYHNGIAVNRESFSVLNKSIETSQDHSIIMSINNNLISLSGLSTNLSASTDHNPPRFDVFEHNGDYFEKAYSTMVTRIRELKEG